MLLFLLLFNWLESRPLSSSVSSTMMMNHWWSITLMITMTTMINECDVVMTRNLATTCERTNKHVPSNLPFGVSDQTFRFFRLAGASTSPSLCSIIVATITLVTVVLVVLLAKNISRRFWTFRFVQILSFNSYFLQAYDADQSSWSHSVPVCCFWIFSGWKVINRNHCQFNSTPSIFHSIIKLIDFTMHF